MPSPKRVALQLCAAATLNLLFVAAVIADVMAIKLAAGQVCLVIGAPADAAAAVRMLANDQTARDIAQTPRGADAACRAHPVERFVIATPCKAIVWPAGSANEDDSEAAEEAAGDRAPRINDNIDEQYELAFPKAQADGTAEYDPPAALCRECTSVDAAVVSTGIHFGCEDGLCPVCSEQTVPSHFACAPDGDKARIEPEAVSAPPSLAKHTRSTATAKGRPGRPRAGIGHARRTETPGDTQPPASSEPARATDVSEPATSGDEAGVTSEFERGVDEKPAATPDSGRAAADSPAIEIATPAVIERAKASAKRDGSARANSAMSNRQFDQVAGIAPAAHELRAGAISKNEEMTAQPNLAICENCDDGVCIAGEPCGFCGWKPPAMSAPEPPLTAAEKRRTRAERFR